MICFTTFDFMNFSRDISLKQLNTFGIDIKTKYFIVFNSVHRLLEIISSDIYKQNKTFVLGGGSNLLFTEDYNGLIIHNKITGINILKDSIDSTTIEVGAGEDWHDFVIWSIDRNLSGIENLSLIPGLVGGTPIQNIGAYGVEVKDVIHSVKYLSLEDRKIKVIHNKDCQFTYRDSIFKHDLKEKVIITSVIYKLSKKPLNKITYGTIKDELTILDQEPSPKSISDAVINIRSRKLPNPEKLGNSGSFFKNPIIETMQFKKLKEKFPGIIGYDLPDNKTKIAAGWLIDNAGLKGYRIADAGVHKDQALVIVNHGQSTGREIVKLAQHIQKVILEKYEIKIEPEVIIL